MSMYCKNCGTENENGTKFCKNCGALLEESKTESMGSASKAAPETAVPEAASPAADPQKNAPSSKPLPKNALIGVAAAGAILVVGGMALGSNKTINLDHYLTVDIEGYDGYGTATATIDWDAIEKKYGTKLKFTDAARKQFGNLLQYTSPIEELKSCVFVSIDNAYDLSNDDTVIYSWEISDDVGKYLSYKIEGKDGSKKVSKLEEVDTFDAFADLDVSFTGLDSDGRAEVNYTGTELSPYDLSCDKMSGLSNGDTVTVSISKNNISDCAKKIGKVPAELSKKYAVEGLEHYVKQLSEISADSLASMQKQAEDVYNAKAAKDWGDGESLESLTYMGDYLLTSKNSNDNYLFLVYKAQVHNNYSNGESTYDQTNDIYWYIRYEDLIADADGNVTVDLTYYSTPNDRVEVDSGVDSGWWSTQKWYYYGYMSLDDLYRSTVTANLDGWNHEDSVGEV